MNWGFLSLPPLEMELCSQARLARLTAPLPANLSWPGQFFNGSFSVMTPELCLKLNEYFRVNCCCI